MYTCMQFYILYHCWGRRQRAAALDLRAYARQPARGPLCWHLFEAILGAMLAHLGAMQQWNTEVRGGSPTQNKKRHKGLCCSSMSRQ